MTQDEILDMAMEEAELVSHGKPSDEESELFVCTDKDIVRFAHLVADKATEEANARANASWTLMCKKMVAFEREACAKVVDDIEARCIAKDVDDPPLDIVATAIRARGEQA